MRGYLLTPARHPRCTTIYWFDQPKRQNESLPRAAEISPCVICASVYSVVRRASTRRSLRSSVLSVLKIEKHGGY